MGKRTVLLLLLLAAVILIVAGAVAGYAVVSVLVMSLRHWRSMSRELPGSWRFLRKPAARETRSRRRPS